jgi:hypothetical protein
MSLPGYLKWWTFSPSHSAFRKRRSPRKPLRTFLYLESLENRTLLAVVMLYAGDGAAGLDDFASPATGVGRVTLIGSEGGDTSLGLAF